MSIEYHHLKDLLMERYPQLVIYPIHEISPEQRDSSREMIYDLTGGYPASKYYLGSRGTSDDVVIVPNNHNDEKTDQNHDQLVMIYNLYGALVRQHTQMTYFEQMETLASQIPLTSQQIHWVWFREGGFRLPNKIMNRAKSWIELNPTFRFTLWTNLRDEAELSDFISQLSESNQQYFHNKTICVQYQDDLENLIKQFCQKLLISDAQKCNDQSLHETVSDKMSVIQFLHYLFDFPLPQVTTTIQETMTDTQHIIKTTISTQTQNMYRINRIFRTDLLRIIILCLHGGIYCDFNDTICLYPMKYLLTFYPNQYFIGTDWDLEHSIFRNNYFIYSPQSHPEFIRLTIQCLCKASHEYQRITNLKYISQYITICSQLIDALNHQGVTTVHGVITQYLQLPSLKQLLIDDPHKESFRVLQLVNEIYSYWVVELGVETLRPLHQLLTYELSHLDPRSLISSTLFTVPQFYYKRGRRESRKQSPPMISLPIIGRPDQFNQSELTYAFCDYFLMKYAIYMTNGDLILSTNIAYMSEFQNMIPYSRLNRLSTLSMLIHLYDGTSYGLNKNYGLTKVSSNDQVKEIDLYHELL